MNTTKKTESLERHLALENLHLIMDIEVLTSFPIGKAAKKIIEKYTRRRKIYQEQLLSIKN